MLFSLSSTPICSFATTPDTPVIIGDSIHLELNLYYDRTKNGIQHPKAPVLPPSVYQRNHTLYLEYGCYDSTIILYDDSGAEVFSYNVVEDSDTIEIPSYISGQYELHIHRGNFCFWGLIEL